FIIYPYFGVSLRRLVKHFNNNHMELNLIVGESMRLASKARLTSVELVVGTLINAFFITLNVVDVSLLIYISRHDSLSLIFHYADWQAVLLPSSLHLSH